VLKDLLYSIANNEVEVTINIVNNSYACYVK